MSKNDGEERIGPLNINEHLTEGPQERTQIKDDDNTLEDTFEEIDTLTQDLRTKQSVYGSTVGGSYISSSTGSNYCDDESQDPASDSITILDDDMKKKLAIKTSAAVSLPGAYDSNNAGIIPKPSQQHLVQIAMLRNEQKMRPLRNNEVGGPIIGPEFEGQHLEDFQGRMNVFIGHANNEDEERQLEQNTKRRRRRCRLLATCVVVLVAIIGIVVGVIVVGGSDNGGDLDKTKSSGASKLCSVNENEVPKSEEQYHELRAWIISRGPHLDVSISTAGSSARKSLCWLAYDDNLKIGVERLEEYHVVERFALVLIYFHFLDGVAGSELSALSTSNWLTGISVCEWDFLSCEDNVIKGILLRSKIPNLGTIPPELTLLSEVVEIDISSNFLTGEIPAELWTMMQLESLTLEFNELTGTFPTEITDLVGLKELRFGNDLLTGTLPDLNVLTNMKVLRVTHSKVFGQFPDISGCTNLGKTFSGFGIFKKMRLCCYRISHHESATRILIF